MVNTKTHIDLFLNTSKYEGIPISIMEAIAYQIPCIATHVGGVPEIINNDNGYLLPINFKPIFLTKIISEYFNLSLDKRSRKRENAYLTWQRLYYGDDNSEALAEEILISK